MKKVVSFSGGRTSAYLCYLMKEKYGNDVDFIYMDTGAEHPKTYKFIREVNEHFGLNLTCLRGDFNQPLGNGHSYSVIDINEICPDLEPYRQMVMKYGTPTVASSWCTSRMKEEVHDKYCDDTYRKGNYQTWIGIRADEPKRLGGVGRSESLKYMAEVTDADKDDVLDFWSKMPFDLEIPEWLGNCVFCFKKSDLKLAAAQRDEPGLYIEWNEMIESAPDRNKKQGRNSAHMYRNQRTLTDVIAMFDGSTGDEIKSRIRGAKMTRTGSCSESCEAFSCDADTSLKAEEQSEIVDIFNTDKKYSVIYCDPAWQFKSAKTGGKLNSGAAQKYTVTSLKDMMRLPVENLAAEDCLLVMWYVGAMPREAIELCEFWGFKLLNMNGFVWDKETKTGKDHFGMGYATRASTESALIGYRGKLSNIIEDRSIRSKIRAKVGRHSEKPNEFREAIVKMCGDVPRIELFSREQFPGWDAWGNELEMMNKQVTA